MYQVIWGLLGPNLHGSMGKRFTNSAEEIEYIKNHSHLKKSAEESVQCSGFLKDLSFMEIDLLDSDDSAGEDLLLAQLYSTNTDIYKEIDFIIIQFPRNKKVHKYICVIQQIFHNEDSEAVALITTKFSN